MALNSLAHPVTLPAVVTGGAGAFLFIRQFGRRCGKSVRPGQRRQRFQAGKVFDRLINGGNTLSRLYARCVPRLQIVFPTELAPELTNKTGISVRIGTSQIDLLENLRSQTMINGRRRGGKSKKQAKS